MASKIKLDRKIKSNIQKFITVIESEGIPVQKVIVFGSYAKGTQGKWSDIDLAVFSQKFGYDYHREMVNLFNKAKRINIGFEPHPFHSDDWNDKTDGLIAEIKKYGQEIPLSS